MKTQLMKTKFMNARRLLLLTLLTLCATSGYAAEAEPKQDSKEDGAAGKPAPPTGASTRPTPEVFVPTEEISEDFAVSFPVDI